MLHVGSSLSDDDSIQVELLEDLPSERLDRDVGCRLASAATVSLAAMGGPHLLVVSGIGAQELEEEADGEVHRLPSLDVVDGQLDEGIPHGAVVASGSAEHFDEGAERQLLCSVAGVHIRVLCDIPEKEEVEEPRVVYLVERSPARRLARASEGCPLSLRARRVPPEHLREARTCRVLLTFDALTTLLLRALLLQLLSLLLQVGKCVDGPGLQKLDAFVVYVSDRD